MGKLDVFMNYSPCDLCAVDSTLRSPLRSVTAVVRSVFLLTNAPETDDHQSSKGNQTNQKVIKHIVVALKAFALM